jgi:hypothetical protein
LSDKDFKVKNKLVVNGLTGGAGPLIANSNKEIDSVAFLTTLQGGTGTTTSPSAGQVLYSAGGTSYNPTALNTLDVKGASYSADAPSSPVIGQIWVESDTTSDSFDPNIIRRKSFTATAAQTVFTTDLEFIQGYEQVFFNGMLLLRNSDYTTASNTNVTLASGAAAGDIVEIVTVTNLNSINAATTTTNTFTGNQYIQGALEASGPISSTVSNAQSMHVDGGGYGYRIRANTSNNAGALQFTNNLATNDWAYINASNQNNLVIRTTTGATSPANYAWLGLNGGPVQIRDITAAGGEASDWPVPSLSIASFDDYTHNTMLGFLLKDDDNYVLDYSKWNIKISDTGGKTTSASTTNMHFGGPGAIILYAGNSESVRIANSGNVGIGYAAPNTKLEIRSANTINDSFGLLTVGSNNFGQDFGGQITFSGVFSSDNNQTNFGPFASVFGRKENGTSGDYAGYLGFGTRIHTGAVTERARFNSTGNLLIGYTASQGSFRLQVNSQIFATSSSIATSDGRYKENIDTITSGLSIIDSLRPVSFTWKEHPVHNFVEGKTVGFIAQEVQEALSEYDWVDNIIKSNVNEETEEEFLGIAESNIIPLLVAAVKELKARVETLEAN